MTLTTDAPIAPHSRESEEALIGAVLLVAWLAWSLLRGEKSAT